MASTLSVTFPRRSGRFSHLQFPCGESKFQKLAWNELPFLPLLFSNEFLWTSWSFPQGPVGSGGEPGGEPGLREGARRSLDFFCTASGRDLKYPIDFLVLKEKKRKTRMGMRKEQCTHEKQPEGLTEGDKLKQLNMCSSPKRQGRRRP